ncbi:MAG TPA: tetraacyldisaccharide 4'-kinase [Gallionellaceae bacterium]|nr:tetraacyldisaccharide 4'-kinase [Gallionellaceae bacterium]
MSGNWDGLQRLWYGISPLHLLLVPLSALFYLLSATRRQLYRLGIFRSVRLPVPVIVVGNITVGGSGKTPLTLWLAQQLIAQGFRPGIVSRGFGGSNVTPQPALPDSSPDSVGDEPVLMAQRGLCPVWVGRDRPAAAQTLLQAHPECDVIISDDGLQHYRLQRDVEIVVVDGVRRFGNGWLLPAGPLREPVARLRNVDAVVVNGGSAGHNEYPMQLLGEKFHNLRQLTRIASAADFAGQQPHALAGIGHPERFFGHLRQMGLTPRTHAFPDHYRYRAEDMAFGDAAPILMTEKDAVKCRAFAPEQCWALRVDAQVDFSLIQHILKKIRP